LRWAKAGLNLFTQITRARGLRDETKAALDNLGFILQINGITLFAVVIASLLFQEYAVSTALGISTSISLIFGYFLSRFFKGGELDFTAICLFITLSYMSFSLIGTVPYLLMTSKIFDTNSFIDTLVDALFESTSSYTTTGLTMVSNIDLLPRSMILLRSTIQWFGGVNIVLLSIIFFISPSGSARSLAELSGIKMIRPSVRSNFLNVIKVYAMYTVVFIPILHFAGGVDLFNTINIVFAGLATGGFLPLKNLETLLNPAAYVIIIAIMILGALNFSVHGWLFGKREKEALAVEGLYFAAVFMLSAFVLLISSPLKNASTMLFHIVSASTTTGFQFLDISRLSDSAKLILILLMFIGGSTLSTAGGIKILRLIIALKGASYFSKRHLMPPDAVVQVRLGRRVIEEREVAKSLLLIFIAAASIVVSTLIFTLYGLSTVDSLFDITSAYATTGLSSGITASITQPELKLLLIFLMVLGRVEVIPILTLIVIYLARIRWKIIP